MLQWISAANQFSMNVAMMFGLIGAIVKLNCCICFYGLIGPINQFSKTTVLMFVGLIGRSVHMNVILIDWCDEGSCVHLWALYVAFNFSRLAPEKSSTFLPLLMKTKVGMEETPYSSASS